MKPLPIKLPSILKIQKDKKLSEISTFGIGGPARFYMEVSTIEEMKQVLKMAFELEIPYFVVGKGSNCLFDDRGFNGLVLLNKIAFLNNPEPGFFVAGAGYSFSLLGTKTARAGWSGLEFASGIPASVGGAIFMNAGANGHETCEALVSVDYLAPGAEDVQTLLKENLSFSYRTSSFQNMPGIILGGSFRLTKFEEARKKQLDIVHYRQTTQPYGEMSIGCIFRNPHKNTSAGELIDRCGLKGASFGDAKISELHANFIVNTANATSEDVKKLIELVREKVHASTGIILESEVRYVPYSDI